MTELRKLIHAAYQYGMKPAEAFELSAAEIAEWVKAQQEKELEKNKFLTKVAYSIGILSSMALAKKRPTYEEIWQWPKDKAPDLEVHKAQMIVWAENANRLARSSSKKEV